MYFYYEKTGIINPIHHYKLLWLSFLQNCPTSYFDKPLLTFATLAQLSVHQAPSLYVQINPTNVKEITISITAYKRIEGSVLTTPKFAHWLQTVRLISPQLTHSLSLYLTPYHSRTAKSNRLCYSKLNRFKKSKHDSNHIFIWLDACHKNYIHF